MDINAINDLWMKAVLNRAMEMMSGETVMTTEIFQAANQAMMNEACSLEKTGEPGSLDEARKTVANRQLGFIPSFA